MISLYIIIACICLVIVLLLCALAFCIFCAVNSFRYPEDKEPWRSRKIRRMYGNDDLKKNKGKR